MIRKAESSFDSSLNDSVQDMMFELSSCKTTNRIQYQDESQRNKAPIIVTQSTDTTVNEISMLNTSQSDSINFKAPSLVTTIASTSKEETKDESPSWNMQPFMMETNTAVNAVSSSKKKFNAKRGYAPPSSDRGIEFKYYGFQRVAVRKPSTG